MPPSKHSMVFLMLVILMKFFVVYFFCAMLFKGGITCFISSPLIDLPLTLCDMRF